MSRHLAARIGATTVAVGASLLVTGCPGLLDLLAGNTGNKEEPAATQGTVTTATTPAPSLATTGVVDVKLLIQNTAALGRVAKFVITVRPASGPEQTREVAASALASGFQTVAFDGIAPGPATIIVRALDAGGAEIASAQTQVEVVVGQHAPADLELTIDPGTGGIALRLSIPANPAGSEAQLQALTNFEGYLHNLFDFLDLQRNPGAVGLSRTNRMWIDLMANASASFETAANGTLAKVIWTDQRDTSRQAVLALSASGLGTNARTREFRIVSSPDGSTARMTMVIDATSWEPDPDAVWRDGQAAYPLFDQQRPVAGSIAALTIEYEVIPQGNQAGKAVFHVDASQFIRGADLLPWTGVAYKGYEQEQMCYTREDYYYPQPIYTCEPTAAPSAAPSGPLVGSAGAAYRISSHEGGCNYVYPSPYPTTTTTCYPYSDYSRPIPFTPDDLVTVSAPTQARLRVTMPGFDVDLAGQMGGDRRSLGINGKLGKLDVDLRLGLSAEGGNFPERARAELSVVDRALGIRYPFIADTSFRLHPPAVASGSEVPNSFTYSGGHALAIVGYEHVGALPLYGLRPGLTTVSPLRVVDAPSGAELAAMHIPVGYYSSGNAGFYLLLSNKDIRSVMPLNVLDRITAAGRQVLGGDYYPPFPFLGVPIAAPAPVPAPTAPPPPTPGPAATSSSAPSPSPSPASVTIQGNAFSPSSVTIAKGGTIQFKNLDTAPHHAKALDGSFDAGTLSKDQSKTVTLSDTGSHSYRCEIHNTMRGTVVVE